MRWPSVRTVQKRRGWRLRREMAENKNWFAWRPVFISDKEGWVWWEYVERTQSTWIPDSSPWPYAYKLIPRGYKSYPEGISEKPDAGERLRKTSWTK